MLERAFFVFKRVGHTFDTFEYQYLRNEVIKHNAVFIPNNIILRGFRLANKKTRTFLLMPDHF